MLRLFSRDFWWNDLDLADRAMLLRLAFPCYLVLLAGSYLALGSAGMSGARGLLYPLVIHPLLALVISRSVLAVLHGVATTALGTLESSAGGPSHQDSFSQIDALVARGEWQAALRYLEQIPATDPRALTAMRRAADLIQDQARDPERAATAWLAVRAHDPEGRHRVEVANRLIDLYRAVGDREGMRGELLRLAREEAGSPLGQQARHALRGLVAEEYDTDGR